MERVPVSTTSPSFDDIKGYLNQIGHHLLKAQAPLLPQAEPSQELRYLERLNGILKPYHQAFIAKGRSHYQALHNLDLQSAGGQTLLAELKATLNKQLLEMDLREQVDGKPRKSFMVFEAGFTALGNEARLGVQDRLLHPQEGEILSKVPLGPTLRPGLYALQFTYQQATVELAGAFVVTQLNSPVVTALTTTQGVGQVMLFTPLRGIESFDSLADLNKHLLKSLDHRSGREEFMNLLPARYQALTAAGIWPLMLSPIVGKPLFEHTFQALVDKRSADVERALSLADNPTQDAAQLIDDLDRAIAAALPDLDARLELRAQALLERCLRYSAPAWYRSASEARRATLAQHLAEYDQARHTLLSLLGPAATPHTLARHEWLERLSDDLAIHDLEPEHLQVSTRRFVTGVGHYEQTHTLTELALRGLHDGDEQFGSDFLSQTTLTCDDAPLPERYADLTPTWLVDQLKTLHPRVAFAPVQHELHHREEVRHAIERLLEQRINALAYIAVLQGHLGEDDFQLIQRLRQGPDTPESTTVLSANTLSLHGAQLQDMWALRQKNPQGHVTRVLLCTPGAPREQQFQVFDSDRACQQHILGWAMDNGVKAAPGTLTDYLISRVPLRFQKAMKQVLTGLSFKPHAQEYAEITFSPADSQRQCLTSMAEHVLTTRTDDYDFGTPAWYRSTTEAIRRKLLTLAEDAEGALRAYTDEPLSLSTFPSFTTYLHEQAKRQLNQLLGRSGNDVDPDTVWAYSPPSLVGTWTPPPLTYTQLFRDGYADGIGFLDEKFSRSATFKGPEGIDLSTLTAQTVARSVTGVWIGQRYIDKVRAELLSPDSQGYAYRRNATLAITQLHMHSAALESRLQGHIAAVDLDWLEKSIASLGDTSARTRGNYAIHRLMVDGEWVIDTLLFSHADNPVLLYTPQAPDGIQFREARQFNYLLKKQPGMIEYLCSRMARQSQVRMRSFLENARKALPEHLNKTDISPARYDSTRRVTPLLDLRQALYNMKLQRRIDDVRGSTSDRTQMIGAIVWSCVEWIAAVATAPFPLVSLATGLLLAFKDAMLALHAYHQGDNAGAFEHFMGYLFNSAGGLLTDLRPALRALPRFSRPSRLPAASPEHARAMNRLQTLESARPALSNMQPVLFYGQPHWAPKTPDVLGRYLLYRLDPTSGQLRSTTRLATPTADGGWVRSGVSGGAPKFEKLPNSPETLKPYEMPAKHWRDLERVMDPQLKADLMAQSEWATNSPLHALPTVIDELRPIRTLYLQQVERLTRDAKAFFDALEPIVPRVDVLLFEASASAEHIIQQLFKERSGWIIGQVAASIASKQFLIDNMDALVRQGLKRLYVEYLPADVFRLKLDKFNAGKSWRHIEKHLAAVDKALGFSQGAQYSYLALARKAREKGVKLLPLDASTSYQLEDALQLGETAPTTPRSNNLRNFYSHRLLEADVAAAPDERWVALVDQTRMSTFEQVPGLADLHKTVALRIQDVSAGQPVGIWADAAGAIPGDALAKGDYKLTLQTAYKAAEAPPASAASPRAATQHFSEFDSVAEHHATLAELSMHPRGLDTRYGPSSPLHVEAFNAFQKTRSRLKEAAEHFFTDYAPAPRPILPTVPAEVTLESFLKQVADGPFSGLVIGEAHNAQSSKALLRTHMKSIKEAGFQTLYVEHLLTDLHQAELDIFHRTQRFPERLKSYLKAQDGGHMPRYRGLDTYSNTIQAAAKHGIRVRALDCTASYHLRGLRGNGKSRTQMFNYFASRVIQDDQARHGPHKWVAFVGSSHTNTYQSVPGLVQLQDAVSLHVQDTASGLGKRIHPGFWEVKQESVPGRWKAVRSDFKLEVEVATTEAPAPFVPVDRSRLNQPGHFLIERPSAAEPHLLHHSSTGEIISTPIQVDDNGLFFINRWGFDARRFEDLGILIETLKAEVHLTPAP